MADRMTKLLLLMIAVGLWLNAIGGWMRPVPLEAAQSASQALEFIDYGQLVQEHRERGQNAQDIQVLLLTHIAGNTSAALGRLSQITDNTNAMLSPLDGILANTDRAR